MKQTPGLKGSHDDFLLDEYAPCHAPITPMALSSAGGHHAPLRNVRTLVWVPFYSPSLLAQSVTMRQILATVNAFYLLAHVHLLFSNVAA